MSAPSRTVRSISLVAAADNRCMQVGIGGDFLGGGGRPRCRAERLAEASTPPATIKPGSNLRSDEPSKSTLLLLCPLRPQRSPPALLHDFELQLLYFRQPLPLLVDQVIDFFVQMPDLELGLEVDLVVVERAQAILRLQPLLAHHDDGCLDGGEARQDQVEQDERIRIERLPATPR